VNVGPDVSRDDYLTDHERSLVVNAYRRARATITDRSISTDRVDESNAVTIRELFGDVLTLRTTIQALRRALVVATESPGGTPTPTSTMSPLVVDTGSSVYMCGHAGYVLRRVGMPGTLSFLAGSYDEAQTLAYGLNRWLFPDDPVAPLPEPCD
jgi:hypothetical protein